MHRNVHATNGGVMKRIGGFLKKIGKDALKGLDVADKVASHPMVVPFTMMIPYGQARFALSLVRRGNAFRREVFDDVGQKLGDGVMKDMFAEDFRKEYPDATDSEIDMLAAAFANVEKGRVEEDD